MLEPTNNPPMDRLPSKGPNSPFSAGTRTIIARTCTKCGELADGHNFPVPVGTRRRAWNRAKNRDRIIHTEGVKARKTRKNPGPLLSSSNFQQAPQRIY